jgi:hypothetical protein
LMLGGTTIVVYRFRYGVNSAVHHFVTVSRGYKHIADTID